jgi:acyl-CoA dehydrogenase
VDTTWLQNRPQPLRARQELSVDESAAADFDELLSLLRDFIRREVMPAGAGIDESGEIPDRLIAQAKQMGLDGCALPTGYGGLGLPVTQQVRVANELGCAAPAFRSLFGTNNGIAGQVLVLAGTGQQRAHRLPRLASGEVVASFALTEPDAGSDPGRLITTARRVAGGGQADGGWVIDGRKRCITNAPAADVFMVFARTGPQAPPACAYQPEPSSGRRRRRDTQRALRSLAHRRLTIAGVCVGSRPG